MKRIILPALCLWAVLGIFSKHGAAQEPDTPAPGTSQRRAVLDAVREALKAFPQRHNPGFQYLREDVRVFSDKPIRFFVDWMKIKGSWAWVEVHGENYRLRLCGLLQKDKGAWQVAALVRPDAVVCAEGPELCLDLRHWLHVAMQRTFPQAPFNIFPQDDSECRAVLRAFAFNQKGPDFSFIFLVTYFRTGNNWAWIETEPRSTDGLGVSEPVDALLEKVQGKWVVREFRPCCGDCADNPDCADDTRYYQMLKQKYPLAPADIFTKRASH
ncbi:MAG: hypothetical protein ACUVSA_05920 [Desulfosoma sp.]|uniref:hypothetical protein n=1 Tax=Desulfosoma sp. TaxID=2603217 RepID=UPI00404B6B59